MTEIGFGDGGSGRPGFELMLMAMVFSVTVLYGLQDARYSDRVMTNVVDWVKYCSDQLERQ